MTSLQKQFTAAITNRKTHNIKVEFVNGRTATYTIGILTLLKSDPMVNEIEDLETGEILYTKAL